MPERISDLLEEVSHLAPLPSMAGQLWMINKVIYGSDRYEPRYVEFRVGNAYTIFCWLQTKLEGEFFNPCEIGKALGLSNAEASSAVATLFRRNLAEIEYRHCYTLGKARKYYSLNKEARSAIVKLNNVGGNRRHGVLS